MGRKVSRYPAQNEVRVLKFILFNTFFHFLRRELVDISERESLEFDGLRNLLNEIKNLVQNVLEEVHRTLS